MSESKNEENKKPSIFGISLNEQDNASTKSAQLFGISMGPVESSTATTYYLTPAITQSLNLLELTLQKTNFEKSDFDTLRSTLSLLPISEISRLRSTISVASLDNLAKKADAYEKNQTIENEKLIPTNQKQDDKNKDPESANQIKLLEQEEINKLMAKFLQERNDLNKNLETKNQQSLETKNPQIG